MTTATLNVKIQPRRMLSAREAAQYCGISAKRFPAHCRVPPVEIAAGVKVYDMRDLDDWLDGIKLGSADSDDDIISRLG